MSIRFKVTIKNEILGDSERIMTLNQIKNFNVGAYWLAQKSIKTGKSETDGMWTLIAI